MHARPPKHLEERFDWYAPVIEAHPEEARGLWKERRMPNASLLHLDLGCGKGMWTCAAALANPNDLYIGFDNETICIAMAAKRAYVEQQVPNVVFARTDASNLENTVAEGEVDVLHLNFSTPCPRAKHAPQRLTHAERLMGYRRLLAPNARIELKTDSQPFFDWTLTQMELAGYRVTWQTRDLHKLAAEHPDEQLPIDPALISGYEKRLVEKGARIHSLIAIPEQAPTEPISQKGVKQGLMDYLPQDLESIDYIPYGMEDSVANFRNRRRNEAAKAARAKLRGNK